MKLQSQGTFTFLFIQFVCIAITAVLFCGGVQAQQSSEIRQKFLAAEQQVWQANSRQYQKLYNELYFYPLRPYLDQKRLMSSMSLAKITEIDGFLKQYRGTPLDWPLRKKWLKYLAKHKKANLFLKYYVATSDAELKCYRLRYQLAAGVPESVILPKVTTLWLVGKSQPKACDPLFNLWKKAGYRTENTILARIQKAADGGKHTLIPYLTMLLPKQKQYLGRLWHQVRRNPSAILRLKRFPTKNKIEANIFIYGLKRLVWRKPDLALKIYKKAKSAFNFNQQQLATVNAKIALALSSKNHPKALQWFHKVPADQRSNKLWQWYLSKLLTDKSWQHIAKALAEFPQQYQQKLQWRYWQARAQLALNPQSQQAKQQMLTLASKRHYYGFMAASFTNKPISLHHNPVEYTQGEAQHLLANPAAKRAFELFHLRRYVAARREWQYWMSQLNDRAKLIAAKLANEQGWYDRAIFVLAKVGYLDDINLRFPLAYQQQIEYNAKQQKIDASWVYAIARRESSFMPDAHSSAGAHGLMQVMPNTARHLMRKKVSKRYLMQPKNNIRLGTKYLKYLLNKNNNNKVLATASYNAGPNRIKAWLKKNADLAVDVWIETIPFQETRDYVKSVLAYQQIYQQQIGKKPSVFAQFSQTNLP